ncbi:hypothetical protein JH06_5669 [Blastocystis sp. subtype 4]|uniref:hypothetical protein n=1 Tax=Blastocystis sp. subtype 4 TaxID=944170 RepID=UPI0007115866|nr:hypothetical protein JH06_5669 [Blastocystis sp. subtype 4]KNB41279.1 hypothetical protein JH06_5669 [Blastocystis sp. subtype 4]|eukprot:XP_014524722.1 hypothetical protein JH06_5669 [Blastocystis sp. subtype 4]
MILLSLCYLVVVGFMTLRVFVKTGERRYHTIHGDSILLIGCCDSGKTALFYATQNQFPETVTSIKENIASITCASINEDIGGKDPKRVIGKIVDIPGHPAVRKFDYRVVLNLSRVNDHIPHAAGIVYMVDGTSYDVKAIAEELYDLFVNPAFVTHPCPLLLAINKSDLPNCEDNQSVFEKIENELDLIKESRGSVEAVGESNTNKLGVEGQKFSFEKDAPCKVYACNCSVKNRDIQKITGFISAALH